MHLIVNRKRVSEVFPTSLARVINGQESDEYEEKNVKCQTVRYGCRMKVLAYLNTGRHGQVAVVGGGRSSYPTGPIILSDAITGTSSSVQVLAVLLYLYLGSKPRPRIESDKTSPSLFSSTGSSQ